MNAPALAPPSSPSSAPVARPIGRYVIHQELASGGMATVHLGYARGAFGFTRVVAIKRLHPQFVKEPSFVAMFTDEARLSSRVQHPNVVGTLDVVSAGEELFVVMEYVAGETLARLIVAARKAKIRLPVSVAAAIVSESLAGLHAAHEATSEAGAPLELVHRDVSPQNIIVGEDGRARVLDFGVAKARGRLQITTEGIVKGKLGYMSPEQLLGDPLDRRTDVYAAGVVLWEALAAKRLFDSDNTLAPLLEDRIAPPSSVAPGVPVALDAVVARALSRNPEDRFPTARAMAEAIARAVPLASTTEVAQWVGKFAQASLQRQASMVAALDVASVSGEFESLSGGGTTPSGEVEAWSSPPTRLLPSTKPRGRTLGVVALAIAVVGTLGIVTIRGTVHETTRPAAGAVDDDGPVSAKEGSAKVYTAAPSTSVTATTRRDGPASAREPDEASVSMPNFVRPAAFDVPPSAPASGTSARPVPRARGASTPSSCNPPYVVAPDGHKTYKRACLE